MVIDTMVFAYALLGIEPFRAAALKAIEDAPTIAVPDSFRAEFTNVLWQWVRAGGVSRDDAMEALNLTEGLLSEVAGADWLAKSALDLSIKHNISAYDALFVELAIQRQTKLLTCDQRLLKEFPQIAANPCT